MAVLFAATYPERTSALVLAFESCGERRFVDFMAPSVARDERFWRWYARYERWLWDRGPRGRFSPRCSRSTCVTSCRLCACSFWYLKVRDADFDLKPNPP